MDSIGQPLIAPQKCLGPFSPAWPFYVDDRRLICGLKPSTQNAFANLWCVSLSTNSETFWPKLHHADCRHTSRQNHHNLKFMATHTWTHVKNMSQEKTKRWYVYWNFHENFKHRQRSVNLSRFLSRGKLVISQGLCPCVCKF